jgi:hypothetical protein
LIEGRESLPYGYRVSQLVRRKVKKEKIEKQEKRGYTREERTRIYKKIQKFIKRQLREKLG